MFKPKIFSYWLQGRNTFFDEYDINNHLFKKQVEIYVDTFPENVEDNSVIRILLLVEPLELNNIKSLVIEKKNLFDHILTYEEFFLNSIKNTVKFEYGTTWINYYNNVWDSKEFSISSVFSGKKGLIGYDIRNEVREKKDKFISPLNFFSGKGLHESNLPRLGEYKNKLFNSMFHICIENVKKKNFFTEKIIDCLISKTIPIYYGCTNICEYFNCDGIFVVDSFSEILRISNELSEQIYHEKIDCINENFERSKKYCDFRRRLVEKIEVLIDNK